MIARPFVVVYFPSLLALSLCALPLAAQTAAAPQSALLVAPNATVSSLETPSPDAELSLEDSIRIALRQNGVPVAAARSFEAARQGVTSARAARAPEVSANLSTNLRNGSGRATSFTTIDPLTGSTIVSGGGTRIITSTSTSTGISISQNIFDGGRTRQRINQANARALNAVGGFGTARNSLAFDVASAFFGQLRQQKLVTQREGQVALAAQQLEAINAQIEAGTAARVDAQTVQVTLSQARFDLATARTNLATAQTNFRNTLGLNIGPPLRLLESPLATETGLPEAVTEVADGVQSNSTVLPETPSPAEQILNAPLPLVPTLRAQSEYLADAARLRPDLLQGRAALQTSESAVKLAQIERKPQISATANYDIDPRNTGSRGFNVGAGISVPIFDGGGRKADVRAAQAELDATRARQTQLEKDVAADVSSAFVSIGGEVERIANARVLVGQARVNLSNASEKYRLGLGTVLDITNAQTQLFNAQTSLTSAVYDFETARAALDRATGRFAWADPGEAPPEAAPATLSAATTVVQTQTR